MPPVRATQLRVGNTVDIDGKLCSVMKVMHRTPGNYSAVIQTRMRDLDSGNSFDRRFRSDEQVEKVSLDFRKMEFLYAEGNQYHFMDAENYEQITIEEDWLGDAPQFMLPNTQVEISMYNDRPVGIELPTSVELTVTETEPSIKGSTVTQSKKPATLETGLVVQVPQFVEKGTVIKVDTRDGSYMDRVS